jgi:hypothetical protein
MVDNPDLMLPTNDLSSYIEAPEPSTREFTENPTLQAISGISLAGDSAGTSSIGEKEGFLKPILLGFRQTYRVAICARRAD